MSDQNKPHRPDLDTSWKPTRWTPTSSEPQGSAPNGGEAVREVLSHEDGVAPGGAPATEVLGMGAPGGAPTEMAAAATPTEVLSEVPTLAPNADLPATHVLGAQVPGATPATEVLTEFPSVSAAGSVSASAPVDAAPTEVFGAPPSQITPAMPASSVLPEAPTPTPNPQIAPPLHQATTWSVPSAPAPQQAAPQMPTPPSGGSAAPSNPYAAPPQGFATGAPAPQPFHASPSAPTPAPYATPAANAGGGAPYGSGPTPGAPLAAPGSAPAPQPTFGPHTGLGAPYSSHGSYAPPSVGARTTASRSSAPLIIGLFTVGIAALLVVIFFVVRAISAIGGAEWSLPQAPDSDPDKTEYVQPERDSANPDATKGMGQGKFEVPTDPWLHSGYSAGVSTWTASGEYIGVSQDKTIIAFRDYAERKITGYDVKTGGEKWRISLDENSYVSCSNVWNGIAYCSDPISNADERDITFVFIDLAKGEITQVDNSGVQGSNAHFLGYWQGYTYWNISSLESAPSEEARPTQNLIALKDGKLQWEIPVAGNSVCLVGDGAIGCQQNQAEDIERIELINGSTGELVAEHTGNVHAQWYRDGFIIRTRGTDESQYRHYLWTGEDMGAVPPTAATGEPGAHVGNLLPMPTAIDTGDLGFVDPSGQSLLQTNSVDDGYAMTDVSTKKVLNSGDNFLLATGDQKGTVYFLKGHDPRVFLIVDENGKEILSEKYEEGESVNARHGILMKRGPSDSTTVYAPQG